MNFQIYFYKVDIMSLLYKQTFHCLRDVFKGIGVFLAGHVGFFSLKGIVHSNENLYDIFFFFVYHERIIFEY